MFEPDARTIEHTHTLPAQCRLITTDTERFLTALG